MITTFSAAYLAPALDVFKQAFREFGYVEGRDYVLEARHADGRLDRLPGLANELVRQKVDVILANPATPSRAAQKATATIPIVMVSAGDPVGSGLVKSLGRPGGNITGTSNSLTDIAPKHLELLRDMIPKLSRVAVLMNPTYPSHRDALKIIHELAPRTGTRILAVEARSADDIEPGFARLSTENAQAMIVVTDPIFLERRAQIASLAIREKLPCAGYAAIYAEDGFLIGYGPDGREFWRRSAYYVDRILKGAKPADLPIEQPTKFELVFNLRTARALGLTIPRTVLVRADRVIE